MLLIVRTWSKVVISSGCCFSLEIIAINGIQIPVTCWLLARYKFWPVHGWLKSSFTAHKRWNPHFWSPLIPAPCWVLYNSRCYFVSCPSVSNTLCLRKMGIFMQMLISLTFSTTSLLL